MKNIKAALICATIITMFITVTACSDGMRRSDDKNDEYVSEATEQSPDSETISRIDVPPLVETVYSPPESDIPIIETEAETTAPETEEIIPEVRISFLAAGDNVIHPNIYMEAARRKVDGGRAYNFKPIYDNVVDMISSADIAFINQETLMAGESYGNSGYPRFNSPQELGYDLCELGFDIINIANNHMADKGASGLADTIKFWKSMDCLMIGGYEDESDYDNIRVYEEQGIKIAMLSYTYGTNGLSIGSSTALKIPYINDDDIIRQVGLAKEKGDLVFVSVHWGDENIFKPNNEQKRLAKLMADLGVDVILGHHPHVLQPIEWIDGELGNKTLCIYSLGNLISTMMQGKNMVGGFLTFDIVKDSSGAWIEAPLFTPTIFFYGTNYFSTKLYFMEDFTRDQAKNHGTQVYGYLDTFEQLIGHATKNIPEEFLPESIPAMLQ